MAFVAFLNAMCSMNAVGNKWMISRYEAVCIMIDACFRRFLCVYAVSKLMYPVVLGKQGKWVNRRSGPTNGQNYPAKASCRRVALWATARGNRDMHSFATACPTRQPRHQIAFSAVAQPKESRPLHRSITPRIASQSSFLSV